MQIWNLTLLLSYATPILQFYTNPDLDNTCQKGSPVKSLYLANVYTDNTSYELVKEQIRALEPDLVALIEVDQNWIGALDLLGDYPHSVVKSGYGNYGVALYSKLPLYEISNAWGKDLTPSILVRVGDEQSEDFVSVIHAMPPTSAIAHRHNRVLFRRIATKLRHTNDGTFIVTGDFNATPHSKLLNKIIWGGNMRFAAQGFGYFYTWSSKSIFRKLSIDHILVKGCMGLKSYEIKGFIGSDHFPVFAEFL